MNGPFWKGKRVKMPDDGYLKKVESASVATAFAKYDFPVPGGPYKRNALHGRLFPEMTVEEYNNYYQQQRLNTPLNDL